MANSTRHLLSKIQTQKVLTKAFTIKGIPSQISHVTYPPTVSLFQICREASAQYRTSAFKPMKISNQRRHVLWVQERNDHKRPDAALKAAVGPDAENMPSVLNLA
jgi:hypothetical protein